MKPEDYKLLYKLYLKRASIEYMSILLKIPVGAVSIMVKSPLFQAEAARRDAT